MEGAIPDLEHTRPRTQAKRIPTVARLEHTPGARSQSPAPRQLRSDHFWNAGERNAQIDHDARGRFVITSGDAYSVLIRSGWHSPRIGDELQRVRGLLKTQPLARCFCGPRTGYAYALDMLCAHR